MLELSINLSFFLMVKTFSQHHFCSSIRTRLLKLPLACRNNLPGCIFLKEINHWLLVFSLPTFNILQKIYSQNDEFLFAAQTWWADLYKFFPYILQIGNGIFVIFLKMKTKKSPNFCFCYHKFFSKPLRENKKL